MKKSKKVKIQKKIIAVRKTSDIQGTGLTHYLSLNNKIK